MNLLSADCRQLVVEAALAGVNHSLLTEAHDILNALPLLIPEPRVRLVCEAMLRFGLGDKTQARALLATSGEEDAHILLGLLR
ncbi:EscG/YscG/SsaH family type III secretion system needle protein co-chaperone [Yersinia similis]|uniref:EscG/YscG/SsaH family type III secretion system needle protein co-chaperone n=1 Tax=Yersinia similis TaxID=367190 RepID=UPI0011A1E4F9|nr:EscG/YscG/SsaH family type III secretion system needle protein co-chaperone [Yersinia similis]